MPGNREDVAKALLALTYVEMMEMSEAFANSLKDDQENDLQIDMTNRDHVADQFRWWAEGYLAALDDEKRDAAEAGQ